MTRLLSLAVLLAAALGLGALVWLRTRRRLGPDADWVEVVRALALPPLDPVIERTVGGVGSVYRIDESEIVTQLKAPERFEAQLWRAGYRRNLVSATKRAPDGTPQVSAWVLRDPGVVGARHQVDVMIFADGRVAAHHEPSSGLWWALRDWTVLRDHYRGEGYDPAAGERILRATVLDS
jgi:hypothetical protein